MKNIYIFLGIWIVIFWSHVSDASEMTITFPSKDGLDITANLYITHDEKNTPLIVLFHQAGWSRGEYLEIAPKLNNLGFNCIAIDLRSGKSINGVDNETADRANHAKKDTQYIDALPDIEAAIYYAKLEYDESKIIVWGSSYSAALVLFVAGEHPDLVDGVVAFAPGEYFSNQGKSKSWIQDSAKKISVPVFITSARDEQNKWSAIYSAINSQKKTFFLPSSKSNHGSRALWEQFDDSTEYWKAVNEFLENNFL